MLALSIGIGIFGFLLLLSIVVYLILRRRVKNFKKRSNPDHAELIRSGQGTAVVSVSLIQIIQKDLDKPLYLHG